MFTSHDRWIYRNILRSRLERSRNGCDISASLSAVITRVLDVGQEYATRRPRCNAMSVVSLQTLAVIQGAAGASRGHRKTYCARNCSIGIAARLADCARKCTREPRLHSAQARGRALMRSAVTGFR